MSAPLAAVNDFVVKFANVNGSGSASANSMFAKSVLRMGVPVAVRNIFPSNIQGLPTWFEVRVTGEGHLGRRGGVDMMVAMNPQTWDKDVAEIEPGGYLFYDSTKPMPPSKFRPDNVLLYVVGDLDASDVEGAVLEKFGHLAPLSLGNWVATQTKSLNINRRLGTLTQFPA